MKHGRKPTYEQRKLLTQHGLDTYDFLVIKTVKNGCLFQNRTDQSLIVCYPDDENIYDTDGITVLTSVQ